MNMKLVWTGIIFIVIVIFGIGIAIYKNHGVAISSGNTSTEVLQMPIKRTNAQELAQVVLDVSALPAPFQTQDLNRILSTTLPTDRSLNKVPYVSNSKLASFIAWTDADGTRMGVKKEAAITYEEIHSLFPKAVDCSKSGEEGSDTILPGTCLVQFSNKRVIQFDLVDGVVNQVYVGVGTT